VSKITQEIVKSNPVVGNWYNTVLWLSDKSTMTKSAQTSGGKSPAFLQGFIGPCNTYSTDYAEILTTIYQDFVHNVSEGKPFGYSGWLEGDVNNTPMSTYWKNPTTQKNTQCNPAENFDCSKSECIPTYSQTQIANSVLKDADGLGPCIRALISS
jgi:hypothetical protein